MPEVVPAKKLRAGFHLYTDRSGPGSKTVIWKNKKDVTNLDNAAFMLKGSSALKDIRTGSVWKIEVHSSVRVWLQFSESWATFKKNMAKKKFGACLEGFAKWPDRKEWMSVKQGPIGVKGWTRKNYNFFQDFTAKRPIMLGPLNAPEADGMYLVYIMPIRKTSNLVTATMRAKMGREYSASFVPMSRIQAGFRFWPDHYSGSLPGWPDGGIAGFVPTSKGAEFVMGPNDSDFGFRTFTAQQKVWHIVAKQNVRVILHFWDYNNVKKEDPKHFELGFKKWSDRAKWKALKKPAQQKMASTSGVFYRDLKRGQKLWTHGNEGQMAKPLMEPWGLVKKHCNYYVVVEPQGKIWGITRGRNTNLEQSNEVFFSYGKN